METEAVEIKQREKERGAREHKSERCGQAASGGSGGSLGLLAVEQHVKQLVSLCYLLYWP